MRKQEEILKDIKALEKELEESKNHYLYTKLTDDENIDERIGYFNIGNAKLIFTELYAGKTLQYRHSVWGNVEVKMNPQRNRTLVSDNDHIKEDNIKVRKRTRND
mgnify:FL=1